MKILVTGAKGFVGKNLTAALKEEKIEVLEYDAGQEFSCLKSYVKEADFVFHLAGVNRPEREEEFMEGNYGFTKEVLDLLASENNKAPIVMTSSIQAELDNPYGRSKKAGENLLFAYGKEKNVQTYIYRLPNLFGKWSRPAYNSAVATFCHNIARGMDITVHNAQTQLTLVYIDDLVKEFFRIIRGEKTYTPREFSRVKEVFQISLGELADMIYSFKKSRETLEIPYLEDGLEKRMYSTYLSFLPENDFSYSLKMNKDDRGSFTEFIKTLDRGQVSVNIAHPGITKGNHWHHTKNEKFFVASGEGIIRFRKVGEEKVIEYKVSGTKHEVLDIPPGYTHNIENTGENDLVTIMWVNEIFNPKQPDTFFLPVE